MLGIVTQDAFLFDASIAENLRFAKPAASDEEPVAAANIAQLHRHIMSLPNRYQTMVGERGHRFSGGEKQRIALARTCCAIHRFSCLMKLQAPWIRGQSGSWQQRLMQWPGPAPRFPSPPPKHRSLRRSDRRDGPWPHRRARKSRQPDLQVRTLCRTRSIDGAWHERE